MNLYLRSIVPRLGAPLRPVTALVLAAMAVGYFAIFARGAESAVPLPVPL